MAQTNFTPILLYASSTPTNVPTAGNLTNSATGSEIAINIADKNLFFKDSGGSVNTVPIRQSSTSSNGWLSATDWNTFNGKASATSGTSILYGNGSGGFSNVTIGTGITFAGGTLSATGSGGTVTSVTGTAPVVSSGGATPAISMAAATSSVNGYLTSTDWTTFNNKGNGTVTSVAALTLGTTGTDLSSSVATGTTTPVITLNVPTASATNRGALSSTDWSTFNGKAPAVTYTTNYIPYGQGTTTPALSANLTFTGSFLSLLGTSAFGASAVRRSDFYFESANRALTATTANLAIGVSTAMGIDVGGQLSLNGKVDGTADQFPFGVIKGAKENGTSGNYAGYLAFGTSQGGAGFAEAMRISSTQGVSIGNTTDPGAGNLRFATAGTNGIYFGTGSRLDTYQEGTFTPVFTSLTVVGTPTYLGTYTRIGRIVFARVVAISTVSTASTNGTTIISGLPYNSNGSSVCYAADGNTAAGYGTGFMATGNVFPPTWAASSSVTITFTYTI